MRLILILCLLLGGCADLKYVECIARDSTARPCN